MEAIMKRITKILLVLLLAMPMTACHYLDVDSELGLTEEDVFNTTKNFKAYFNTIFSDGSEYTFRNIHCGYPLFIDWNRYRFTWACVTDAADAGRYIRSQYELKACNMTDGVLESFSFCPLKNKSNGDVDLKTGADKPIAYAMFNIIRIANRSLENMDRLTNATEEEKLDLTGQAYFVRGYAHFVLCNWFGGMPYLDHALTGDDEWDLPRESARSTYEKAAADLHTAYEYLKRAGKMRRDALPGQSGHLTSSELYLPSGCCCLAFRARALLYAASPLANESNDPAAWQKAAEACAEALQAAEEWQYELLPLANYKDNFYGQMSTNETLFGYYHKAKINISNWSAFLSYPQCYSSTASGTCPTQNFVDKFETIDGYPLNTAEDRAKATAAGSYNEQNMYARRDPRLDICVVHDGSTTPYVKGVINIYYDPSTKTFPTTSISGVNQQFSQTKGWGGDDSATKAYTNTGYYCNKHWRGARGDKDASHYHLDPLFRMAELYLDYAEAVNEFAGPDGTAGSCNITALGAINKVRTRVGMPGVRSEFTASKEAFRDRIRNERNVELAYEGNHYYFDIRRWKIAPETMTQTLYGMWVESCAVDAAHPAGRVYERRELPANRNLKTWKDCMYYLPFPDAQANTMKNFVNWQKWQ